MFSLTREKRLLYNTGVYWEGCALWSEHIARGGRRKYHAQDVSAEEKAAQTGTRFYETDEDKKRASGIEETAQ